MNFENDMLYLSLCALKGIKPSLERVKNTDPKKLYKSCCAHNVTALVCYALEEVVTPPELWLEAKGQAIRKNMLFDAELSKITAYMDKCGIFYLPLKGILLKEYYPKAGMRQMSDNDIYYDSTHREEIEEYMLSQSYECIAKTENHDVYKRPPVYNFEMHHLLFSKESSEVFYEYYSDINNRMISDGCNTQGYHLSDEDFYIFIVAHEYKHFAGFGTGVRSLLDIIVILDKFGKTLDWDYIQAETEKLGIADFEQSQRSLCRKLVTVSSEKELTAEEEELLQYFLSEGVYGNYSTGIVNRLTGETGRKDRKVTFSMKVKYIFRRLFPPMEFYRLHYPFFHKYKILIPCCFFYRVYMALFRRSSFVETEIKALKNKN